MDSKLKLKAAASKAVNFVRKSKSNKGSKWDRTLQMF